MFNFCPVSLIYKTKILHGIGFVLSVSMILSSQPLISRSNNKSPELNQNQCQQLYTHQLFLMQSSLNPIALALKKNRSALESSSSRALQLQECSRATSQENFQCQMAALTPLELLRCQEKHGSGAGKKIRKNDNNSKKRAEDTPGMKLETTTRSESDSQVKRGVSASNCRYTYDHLLSIYSRSSLLPEGAEGKRLLKHWRSKAARDSFERRCLSVFTPDDIKCVVTSREPISIQACLINVPPES